MRHYNFTKIKERGSCIEFCEQILGAKVDGNRCAAVWRDGERDSVAVEREKWFDHATQQGGGLIDLCAVAKFGGTDGIAIQRAQEFLGDWLKLEEVKLRKAPNAGRNRHAELIAEGYAETARYDYVGLDGAPVYFVCRMEHPTLKKEFVQGTPDHWGISDITPIPYNWPAVAASTWCVIVEGEKDVETLKQLGIPATTNSGGAKKWRPEFAEYLRGKQVIILPDNDEPGREHAELVARDLAGVAAGVKVVQCSALDKGDVTDYLTREGGDWSTLAAKIKAAPPYERRELSPAAAAKEANRQAFRNFIVEEREVGKRKIKDKTPRLINELVRDLHTRLLGAPHRVGEQMFDQDRDTGSINYIYDQAGLFSWIARKTNNNVEWSKIDGCVTKAEFFEALRSEAREFSAVSFVPDHPRRNDVYYAHPELPPPTADHSAFWNLVDFFNPADEINRSLAAAFIMSPIFYLPKVDKPLWVIDSPDGQGSGKSTLPFLTAAIYGYRGVGGEVIDVSLYDLDKNFGEVVKRLISANGRNSRIFLLDNVKGNLRSANLAKLVTASSISGRASYGRGEEARPNNLTYVVTVNSATVDTDIASRAFYLMVKKPRRDAHWKENVIAYIEQNRMKIFADIIDMIDRHRIYDLPPATRTPEFETRVLQAACGSPEQYQRVIDFLIGKKEETNTDEEIARRIEEEIAQKLREVKPILNSFIMNPEKERIFIRSCVIEEWFRGKTWIDRHPVSVIRNLAQTAMLPQVCPKVQAWPHHSSDTLKRRSGILWNPAAPGAETRIIGLVNDREAVEIVGD